MARHVLCSRCMTSPLHEQIAGAMKRRGVTQAALARALGHASNAHLSRILAGVHEPDDHTLQRLANALEVELVRPAVASKTFAPANVTL
jgi:transcriptional regulator with XRE-family HTH domain